MQIVGEAPNTARFQEPGNQVEARDQADTIGLQPPNKEFKTFLQGDTGAGQLDISFSNPVFSDENRSRSRSPRLPRPSESSKVLKQLTQVLSNLDKVPRKPQSQKL